jgi:hypothetical protein
MGGADLDSPRGGAIRVTPQNLLSLSQSLPEQDGQASARGNYGDSALEEIHTCLPQRDGSHSLLSAIDFLRCSASSR